MGALIAYRRSLIVFLLLGIIILGGGFYGFKQAENVKSLATGIKESESERLLVVYVCGAVNKPGVIKLNEGARVVDAVKACGDLLPSANPAGINMAQVLKDGAQIIVPEKPNAIVVDSNLPEPSSSNKGAAGTTGKININTADAVELDRLPGIGPAMAAAIVEYRKCEGSFQTLDDLMKVRGIGEAKYRKLQDKITL